MTKIEKIGQQYSPLAIRGVINNLVDAVNELQSKLVDFDHVADGGKLVCKCGRDDVCTCGEKVSIREEEDLLVPDEVEFISIFRGGIGLVFGEECSFYRKTLTIFTYSGTREVVPRHSVTIKENRVKCRLVPCKLEDVEVGEWFIKKGNDKSEVGSYYLYLGQGRHRTSKGAYACADDGISVYEIFGDMKGHKVVPCE